MLYNTTHKFTKLIPPIFQEHIYNCPEYFAMSRDEIVKSGCPEFLKQVLDEFPWKDRPNVIQVRPQDFRNGKPILLGDGWHVDMNARLNDGKVRVAKSMEDFRLLVCSFGDVVTTDFISTPLELPSLADPAADHGKFFGEVNRMKFDFHSAAPNQLAEYTSRDIHRMGQKFNIGRFRLMIVAFESDGVIASGIELPSIRAKDIGASAPKFEEYVK